MPSAFMKCQGAGEMRVVWKHSKHKQLPPEVMRLPAVEPFVLPKVARYLNLPLKAASGKRLSMPHAARLYMPMVLHFLRGMPPQAEGIKSHIAAMATQRQDFGTLQVGEADGRLKHMKKWEEALGFIRGGTKIVLETIVEGVIRGLTVKKWQISSMDGSYYSKEEERLRV